MKFKKFTSLFLSLAMIFAAMGNLCITASAEEVYEFTYNITNESSVAKSFDIILALCNENGGVETCDVRNVLVEANSTLTETVSVSVEEYVYLAQIYCSYNGILLNDWVEISLDGGIRSYDYQFSCTSFNTDGISAETNIESVNVVSAIYESHTQIDAEISANESCRALVTVYNNGTVKYVGEANCESGITRYSLALINLESGMCDLCIGQSVYSFENISMEDVQMLLEELNIHVNDCNPDAVAEILNQLTGYGYFPYLQYLDVSYVAESLCSEGVSDEASINKIIAMYLLNENVADVDIYEIYSVLELQGTKYYDVIYMEYLSDEGRSRVDESMYGCGFAHADEAVQHFNEQSFLKAISHSSYGGYAYIEELIMNFADMLGVDVNRYLSLSSSGQSSVCKALIGCEFKSISHFSVELKALIANYQSKPNSSGSSGGGGGSSATDEAYFEFSEGIITKYTGSDTEVVIPDYISEQPVISIADEAFANTGVTSVYIPGAVESIGITAFSGIEGLIIKGIMDTYAENYAVENGYTFMVDIEGDGSEENPCQIYDDNQFKYAMKYLDGENIYFEINECIKLEGFTADEIKGIWDGNGNWIYNSVPLCVTNSGTVRNIIYSLTEQVTGEKVGGFCRTNNGTIEMCMVKGEVYASASGSDSDSYTSAEAAMIAYANGGIIKNCGAMGDVQAHGTRYASGIACGITVRNGGAVQECYVAVTLDASKSGSEANAYEYPIVYYDNYLDCYYDYELFGESEKTYNNALTTAEMTSSEFVSKFNAMADSSNSLWVADTDGINNGYPAIISCFDAVITSDNEELIVSSGTKVSLYANAQDCEIYYTLNGAEPTEEITVYTEPLEINESTVINAIAYKDGLPRRVYTFEYIVPEGDGSEENPYKLSTESELKLLREYPTACFELENDICMTEEWEMITDFSGVLDGNGYTLSGFLSKTVASENNGAFIGKNSGTIKNLNLEGRVSLSSNYQLSRGTSMAGITLTNYGEIDNCHFKGTIYSGGYGSLVCYAGGIAAFNTQTGIIKDSSAQGDIFCKNADYIGGLVGSDRGEIVSCYAKCNLKTDSGNGTPYMGGLIGYRNSGKELKYCYAEGDLYAETDYWFVCVGGLIGCNYDGDVSYCYANTTIGGYSYRLDVGRNQFAGFIADNGGYTSGYGGNVYYCYASCTINPNNLYDKNSFILFNNTSNKVVSCGKENFDNWDCLTVWSMGEDGNPYINLRSITDLRISPEVINAELYSDVSELDMTVTAINENGEEAVVTDYTTVGIDLSSIGEKKFTIEYKGYSEEFDLVVSTDIEYAPEGDFDFSNGVINKYIGSSENVIIPEMINGEAVTQIAESAFAECDFITSVTLPEGIKIIQANAFSGCSSIQQITIPASVTSIAEGAFSYMNSLENIYTEEGNKYFASVDGVLIDGGYKLHSYPAGRFCDYKIPAEIEYISAYAFAGSIGVKSIAIPEAVSTIGAYAFADCTALSEINLTENIISAEANIFDGCEALEDVEYPGTWENYVNMFGSNHEIVWCWYTFPDGGIGVNDFGALWIYYVVNAENIKIPSGAKTINYYTTMSGRLYGIKRLYIPSSIINIEANLSESGTLEEIYYEGNEAEWCNISNDWYYYECWNENGEPIYDENGKITVEYNQNISSWLEVTDGCTFGAKMYFEKELPKELPESEHPYPENTVKHWIFEGAEDTVSLNITFSEDTHTYPNDYIYLFDKDNNQIGKYNVVDLASTTVTVPGNKVKIRFVSDEYNPDYYGFKVVGIEEFNHIHIEETIPAVEATCTETGLTDGVRCSECGYIITAQKTISAKGHRSKTLPAVEATCTEDGLTEGSYCVICGEVFAEQETVPAKGHTEVTDPRVEPTATENGLTEGSHCSVCEVVIIEQEIIPAEGEETDIEKEPSVISISNVTTLPGKAISVTVDMADNTGFTNLGIEVGYDSDIMTLTSVENNTVVGATYTPAQSYEANPYNMSWDSAENTIFNGTLVTMTYEISENAPDGVYAISIDYYKGRDGSYKDGVDVNYDEGSQAVYLIYESGSVTVINHIPGDVNGDEKVNNHDGTALLRYLAGWDIEGINTQALDIDGNGRVNSHDGTALLRYLAGWDVVIY